MRNLYKKEGWRGKDIAGNFKQYYPRAINCHMKKKLNDRSGDKCKFNGAKKKKNNGDRSYSKSRPQSDWKFLSPD